MTKQSKIFGMLAIVGLSAMMMISCGGGSGSVSSKKLAGNEVFGDLPNLVYQKHFSDSVLKVEQKAELGKLNPKSKSDWEKGSKIKEKFETREREEKAKYEAEIEKIKQQLVGKEIPFEVEEGAGFEITSCKISDVSRYGTVSIDCEAKITDVATVKFSPFSTVLKLEMLAIDKNGNQIIKDDMCHVSFPKVENGAIGKKTAGFYISKEFADFAKVKFVNSVNN